jgi:predicted RNA binding protein YcfA (HicA-like mRNA interferase family)
MCLILTSFSSKEILQILAQDGWMFKRQRGSHIQLEHPIKKGKVTVPHPRKNLKPKIIQTILKQAGLK